MSAVTAQKIKELRDRTGVGMTKCKEALVETSGDIEKAIETLRKSGAASAVKKQARETNEGAIVFAENDHMIAMFEMNAETDFVVNNERFKEFQDEMALEILKSKPKDVESFISVPYSKEPSKTIDERRRELIAVLGENIKFSRLFIGEKKKDSSFGLYSHMNGKICVLVEIAGSGDEEELARNIAMHVAAEAPDYLKADDVPSDVKAREEDIAKSGAPANKPANIIEKIVQGKMKAFYDGVCLLNQKYIKDNAITIAELVAARSKETGKQLEVVNFIRWQIGA